MISEDNVHNANKDTKPVRCPNIAEKKTDEDQFPVYHAPNSEQLLFQKPVKVVPENTTTFKAWASFGSLSLIASILGIVSVIPALTGINETIVYIIPLCIFGIAITLGIIPTVKAHGKYWGYHKVDANNENNVTKGSFVRGIIGISLAFGWPVLGLIGLFVFMLVGSLLFAY